MKKTYRGSCHCGRVRFEVDTILDEVRSCDCSICRRRGALTHRVDEGDLRLLTALEDLSLYQWNTKTAKDYFCPQCGILPFRRPRTAPDKWAINARCLEDVDLAAIPVKPVHGSKLDVA
ncbi:MAG TPA: GFA family protein [Usitatibacter sp.]|nr:GFA family protein [Usitatibacter sp.]